MNNAFADVEDCLWIGPQIEGLGRLELKLN